VGFTGNFVPDCLFGNSNVDTTFLPDCTELCSVFSCCWIENLIRIPKMCLKLPFSHYNWVLQSILYLTVFLAIQILTPLFSLTVLNFVVFFLCFWIGNLVRIPKMYLKLSFSHYKWVLHAILSLTVFLNCLFDNSNVDTTFLPDCTEFCSVFSCSCIENLMRIRKMCLKQPFSNYN